MWACQAAVRSGSGGRPQAAPPAPLAAAVGALAREVLGRNELLFALRGFVTSAGAWFAGERWFLLRKDCCGGPSGSRAAAYFHEKGPQFSGTRPAACVAGAAAARPPACVLCWAPTPSPLRPTPLRPPPAPPPDPRLPDPWASGDYLCTPVVREWPGMASPTALSWLRTRAPVAVPEGRLQQLFRKRQVRGNESGVASSL
jgi:hypothetical protein